MAPAMDREISALIYLSRAFVGCLVMFLFCSMHSVTAVCACECVSACLSEGCSVTG